MHKEERIDQTDEGKRLRLVLIVVPVLWLAICLFLGVRASWRVDIVFWQFLAMIPMIISLLLIYRSRLLQTSQILMIIGASLLIYVVAMLLELAIIYAVYFAHLQFSFELSSLNYFAQAVIFVCFAFSVPGAIEELAKFAIILTLVTNDNYKKPFSVVLIGLLAAVTMATIENCQYILTSFYNNGNCCKDVWTLADEVVLRDLFSVTLHVAAGVMIACALVDIHLKNRDMICIALLPALLLPIFLHAFYDGILLFARFLASETHEPNYYLISLLSFPVSILSSIIAIIKARRIAAIVIEEPAILEDLIDVELETL